MVKLQLEISKHVTGFVHVQTNPYYSYDTMKTVKNAESTAHLKELGAWGTSWSVTRNRGAFQALGRHIWYKPSVYQDTQHVGRPWSMPITRIIWNSHISNNSLHHRASLDGWKCGMRVHRSLRQRTESSLWRRVGFIFCSRTAAYFSQASSTTTNLWIYVFTHIACIVLIK